MHLRPHHVGLTVPDLESALAWYAEHLGFQITARQTVDPIGLEIALIQSGEVVLELFGLPQTRREEPAYSGVAEHLPIEGWRHIAFQVDALEPILSQWQGHIVGEPVRNEALGYTYAFVADPFGNLIEFVELI